MKTTSPITNSRVAVKPTRSWSLLLLAISLSLFGTASRTQALIACAPLSTNRPAGFVAANVNFRPPGFPVAPRRQSLWGELNLTLHHFWWEVRDCVQYGAPHLVRNEQPTVIAAGFALISLAVVVFRSLGKRHLPTPASPPSLEIEFAPVVQFNPRLNFRRPPLDSLKDSDVLRRMQPQPFAKPHVAA